MTTVTIHGETPGVTTPGVAPAGVDAAGAGGPIASAEGNT
ncbi:hypothetical [Yersinia pestis KIM10+]|uniref:Uncharacterized protein n=1 Tax=Yersinia pestis TaxID=632 RepID=Q8CLU4_YERPE|nr:hypothetical [Yersinia pestis KIM10+]